MAFDYTDNSFGTPLIRAVLTHEALGVRKALDDGFNANLPDNRGWTPVHEAAIKDDRCDCLKILLTHPSADINRQTFNGETALFLACQNGALKCVNLLIKQFKCNVNLPNNEGVSPLHIACNAGHLEVIKCLIDFGAKVNAQDFSGYTPLHEAVAAVTGVHHKDDDCFEICHYLLNHGANPDVLEYDGNYPFHIACQNGMFKCINLLMTASKQCDLVNFCNSDRRSPLMLAVQSKNIAVVQDLLLKGANTNIVDKSNITALHLAAHSGNSDIFNTILKTTSYECILNYCTFNENRDIDKIFRDKRLNSLICLAIDTEDLPFLINVLESNLDEAVLQCPVVHAENLVKKTFTLHTPISFLMESKMYDLGEKTLEFLSELIKHKSPLKVAGHSNLIHYVNPVCGSLIALNDCPKELVLRCLQLLLQNGADPDEPYGRMPFAMEQACMRNCPEAVLKLLQYSNVLEPEDVLKWIEKETSSNQEKIVETLLPLSPYYSPSKILLPDVVDSSRRKALLTPKVHSLANYCRSSIRKQIHEETKKMPLLFQQKLSKLGLPKDLYNFVKYIT